MGHQTFTGLVQYLNPQMVQKHTSIRSFSSYDLYQGFSCPLGSINEKESSKLKNGNHLPMRKRWTKTANNAPTCLEVVEKSKTACYVRIRCAKHLEILIGRIAIVTGDVGTRG